MKIDEITIKKIAALAAIEMGPEELEAQRQDLENIATFAEKLSGFDAESQPEQTHPFGVDSAGYSHADAQTKGQTSDHAKDQASENRLREDKVTNKDRSEEWLKSAPDPKEPYFRAPGTIEWE